MRSHTDARTHLKLKDLAQREVIDLRPYVTGVPDLNSFGFFFFVAFFMFFCSFFIIFFSLFFPPFLCFLLFLWGGGGLMDGFQRLISRDHDSMLIA